MPGTVLISGAGVAGPTLAYWLRRRGFTPTIVERAPAFRQGGQIVDFWGLGFDVAERMALVPRLRERGYVNDRAVFVRADGKRTGGFGAAALRRSLGDRYLSLQRGDLAKIVFDEIEAEVETRFADEIVGLSETSVGVTVEFRHARPRAFDLVVGADGLHSGVRKLIFPESLERYLGYYAAVLVSGGYPQRNENTYFSYAAPGRQISRFALSQDRTGFLFVFAREDRSPGFGASLDAQKAALIETFSPAPWVEWPEIRRRLESADELYFDAVSQISLPAWSAGRVALVGDAAYCPSLLAGEGAALAMAGAYVLAGELRAAGDDHGRAFRGYEARYRPFIEAKQASARGFASSFTPKTPTGLAIRNLVLQATSLPLVSSLLMRRFIDDRFVLPAYPDG